MKKTAVIIAWRKGESELEATIESAKENCGANTVICPVEDTDASGPGRTRHRGIMQMADCDVIVIIDAHMRFKDNVIKRIASYTRRTGNLACPVCHHNGECDFTGGDYHGGHIEYKTDDPDITPHKSALTFKWNHDAPDFGPIGCVGGACYSFARKWYLKVGRPLAALPGWGGDEEALSISAWLSGKGPVLFNGHVAHRWRARAPWAQTPREARNIELSRMALVNAIVADPNDRRELLQWMGFKPAPLTAEVEHWRDSLLRLPHTYAKWKAAQCQSKPEESAKPQTKQPKKQQSHHPRIVVPLHGIVCPHCRTAHDPLTIGVTHTYPHSRAHKCPKCGRNFITMMKANG